MKQLCYSVFLAAGLLPLLRSKGAAADTTVARQSYFEGQAYYHRGDVFSALSALNKAIDQDPSFLPSYSARALARHTLGDDAHLKNDLSQALSISGDDPVSLVALGDALVLKGNLPEAIDAFNRALRKDPINLQAYLGRGRAHRAEGDLKSAIIDWSDAIQLDPNMPMAYFNRGFSYYRLGQTSQAVDDLARALRVNPKFFLPYAVLGEIFAQRGDFSRSISAYSKAILIHPQYAFAYLGRAAAYLQTGRKDLAFRDYDEAIRSSPNDYAPYYNRGEVRWRLGEQMDALNDFRKVLETDINNAPATLIMGDRFMKEHDTEDAVRMFGRGVEAARSAPSNVRPAWLQSALIRRANAYAAEHEYENAIKDLNEVVAVSSNSAAALTARGTLLIQMKRDAEAQTDLDLAIGLDPRNARAHAARGFLLQRAFGRNQAALEDYNAAILYDPRSAEAYKSRGLLYALVFSDYNRATNDLAAAIRLHPGDGDTFLNLGSVLYQRGDYLRALAAFDQAARFRAPALSIAQWRATTYASLGDMNKALGILREHIEREPKAAALYETLGHIRLAAGDPAQAAMDLGQAAGFGEESASLHRWTGIAEASLGHYEKAAAELRRAVELAPGLAKSRADLCRALRLNKEPGEAVKECTKAVELTPRYAPAYLDRGMAELDLHDDGRAAADLRQGYQLGARYAGAELARSLAHARLKQWRDADEAYRSAADLDPMARKPEFTTWGDAAALRRDYAASIQGMESSMSREDDNPYVHLVQGDALHNAGLFDKAILEYTQVLDANDHLAAAFMDRCAALSAQQSLAAAEQDCRRAVELAPNDPRTHAQLLALLTLRRKFPAAAQAAAAGIRYASSSPEFYVRAGNLRYFIRDAARAQENYALALSIDPGFADAHNGLGLCLFARKRYPEAIEAFSRAIAISDRNDRYFRNRAAAYVNLRDFANAASDYKRALAVNSDPEMVSEYRKLIQDSLAQASTPR